MSATRYALLIGINDYKKQELHYCNQDVYQIRQRLVNQCDFNEQNIICLVSTNQNPIEDIYMQFLESVEMIKKVFIAEVDLIQFYFSGHGKFEEETKLEFHDTQVSVQEIFNHLSSLNPSNSIIILDACHSGFGIDIKSTEEASAMVSYYNQRYIAKSNGTYFLCSCKQDEKSRAFGKYNGSVYTKYLCEAIDNSNIYDKDTLAASLFDIHQYAAKRISLSGDYQQTPFFQSQSHGYFPFSFLRSGTLMTSCKISLDHTNDENEVVNFLLKPQLNMTDEFRRDLGQFLSEMVLNIFKHNYSKSISISITGNKIEVVDNSQIAFNPFTAEEKDDHYGVRTYNIFLEKYNGKVATKYTEGTPNIIELEFNDSIFSLSTNNPCHIELPSATMLATRELNKYDFDEVCDEILLDISKTITPLSFYRNLFDYLLERTSKKKPLLILKMHKDDMLRSDVKTILERFYPKERLILI
ncbi:caspase family protein [Lacibacter sp.]|uniref:caspase family protein n=1 Tax=Lacibacter sp. TaxID=1915409 RepID=UPI002B4B16E5|nr:caspase family protein [Lacibacter sp.]HLP35960.1 caspase family protein [Lacibacter sp.]